MSVLDLTF